MLFACTVDHNRHFPSLYKSMVMVAPCHAHSPVYPVKIDCCFKDISKCFSFQISPKRFENHKHKTSKQFTQDTDVHFHTYTHTSEDEHRHAIWRFSHLLTFLLFPERINERTKIMYLISCCEGQDHQGHKKQKIAKKQEQWFDD